MIRRRQRMRRRRPGRPQRLRSFSWIARTRSAGRTCRTSALASRRTRRRWRGPRPCKRCLPPGGARTSARRWTSRPGSACWRTRGTAPWPPRASCCTRASRGFPRPSSSNSTARTITSAGPTSWPTSTGSTGRPRLPRPAAWASYWRTRARLPMPRIGSTTSVSCRGSGAASWRAPCPSAGTCFSGPYARLAAAFATTCSATAAS
mmetsp:Transcript_67481/g.206691  ORF Transcript_67481/g.206691 Transcript_67481/m.206691 type:complete len:205 (-) Transcript_67481:437-1051(-)